jgi:hypothetical protein
MGASPSLRLLNEPFPHEFWKTRKPERWLGYGITWATMGVNGIKEALMRSFRAVPRVGYLSFVRVKGGLRAGFSYSAFRASQGPKDTLYSAPPNERFIMKLPILRCFSEAGQRCPLTWCRQNRQQPSFNAQRSQQGSPAALPQKEGTIEHAPFPRIIKRAFK